MVSDREHFLISIVIPVFRCHDSLKSLADRLWDSLGTSGNSIELILVDDGAPDLDWSTIKSLHSPVEIRAIRLSRNFGQQRAMRVGIEAAAGNVVVVMDCDLQDPPELIPELIEPILERSVDVSFSRRLGSYDQSSRKLSRRLYSSVLKGLTGIDIPEGMGPVALSRAACDYILEFREDAHLFHVINWVSLPHTYVDYVREPRPHGTSSYSFQKRLRHAVRGLAFSANRVFAIALFVSIGIGLSAIVATACVMTVALLGNPPNGWLTLILVMTLGFSSLGVLLSMSGGLLLEILALVRARPFAIVREEFHSKPTDQGVVE